MTTITDLPFFIQDRIRMEADLMIMAEEERKAYILRCCALRRQPFVEGRLDPIDFYETRQRSRAGGPCPRSTPLRGCGGTSQCKVRSIQGD